MHLPHEAYFEQIKLKLAKNTKRLRNGCLVWTKSVSGGGYGALDVSVAGKPRRYPAHRASYMVENGEIPEGMFVCHRCDNRRCCEPKHLFLGTQRVNMRDASKKRRIAGRKLTPRMARHAYTSKATVKELAVVFEVSTDTIESVRARRTYAAETAGLLRASDRLGYVRPQREKAEPLPRPKGPRRVLTDAQAREIFLAASGVATLPARYGVSYATVQSIRARRKYRAATEGLIRGAGVPR